MNSFKPGDIAYIVESGRVIREGKIMRCSGGLYMLRFTEGGGTTVKEHRLYHREEDAQAEIDRIQAQRKQGQTSPEQRLALYS